MLQPFLEPKIASFLDMEFLPVLFFAQSMMGTQRKELRLKGELCTYITYAVANLSGSIFHHSVRGVHHLEQYAADAMINMHSVL